MRACGGGGVATCQHWPPAARRRPRRRHSLQYDDGIQDAALGEGPGWDFFWLNRFSRQAGGEVITDVSIFLDYTMPTDAPFKAVLWNDSGSSGNPADARVAALVDALAYGSGGPGEEVREVVVDIADTLVTDYFFVGAYIGFGVCDYPAGICEVGWLPGRSYGGGSDIASGPSDLNDLPGNPDAGWHEEFGFEYVNMIRATGTAETVAIPEPASMTLLALAGLALLRRARRGGMKHAR